MGSTGMPSIVLHGDVYTVEPGYDECARYLSRPLRGGIGALDPMGTKYYHYGCPHLRDFLNIMDYVDDDVRFYCTTSRLGIRCYARRYLSAFLTGAQSSEIERIIDEYLLLHSHIESGFKENIVIGTPFFNDLFYRTSWEVAKYLFSSDALSSLQSSFQFIRGYSPIPPQHKVFVNYFDGGSELRFFFDVRDGACRMDDTLFIVSKDFHCSREEFERSFQPYILFLSNWTLILACYMCMHEFGQCAFGLYWETGCEASAQRRQRQKWFERH